MQFALVIARMIETVKNSPDELRQAVYDLARFKLQEQFTHADAKNIRRTQEALETAIRGVEEFSKQQIGIEASPRAPELIDRSTASRTIPPPDLTPPMQPRPRLENAPEPPVVAKQANSLGPLIKRTAAIAALVTGVLLIVQQRERWVTWVRSPPPPEERQAVALPQTNPPTQTAVVAPVAPASKTRSFAPLRLWRLCVGRRYTDGTTIITGTPTRYPSRSVSRFEGSGPRGSSKRTSKIYRVSPRRRYQRC